MRYSSSSLSQTNTDESPSPSGGTNAVQGIQQLLTPWQPSTWPPAPTTYNNNFKNTFEQIIRGSLLVEIENVISDAPTLEHRGHVVALAILCAIDALASYAYFKCLTCNQEYGVGSRYKNYIQNFFPSSYQQHAWDIYKLYRNPITHSWNLFEGSMLPDDSSIQITNGYIELGLKNFFDALQTSFDNFLGALDSDQHLQRSCLARYQELQQSARP